MKNILVILFVFFFNSSVINKNMKYQISDQEKAVNKQMASSAQILGKKYNMRPCATSVAMPGGNIQYLELEFDVIGPLPRDTIRKLLINSVHDFLSNINNDTELCSYLKNGHLNISEVGIGFFFFDSTRRPIGIPEIGVASIEEGNLTFITLEPGAVPSFRDTYYETYKEALQILQSQNECSAVQKWCTESTKEPAKPNKNQ